MKLYLSSYRLGNHTETLKQLVGIPNAKVAVSVNALDCYADKARTAEVLQRELADMTALGFEAEQLDLRNYFGSDGLLEAMASYDLVWFSGGNTFILAKAMRQSGFRKVVSALIEKDLLVYAGYSAAFCVLAKSLHGVELVDDQDIQAEGYDTDEIWDGLGIIDFHPIVHFRSNHHETEAVEMEYKHVVKNKIPHKTLKDGDVYLVDGDHQALLT